MENSQQLSPTLQIGRFFSTTVEAEVESSGLFVEFLANQTLSVDAKNRFHNSVFQSGGGVGY